MADFPFDVVAFDLDGTLADTAPDLTAALNHALAQLGRPPVPAEDVRHMVGHGARALLQKGLAATGEMSEELVERGFPIFIDYYLAHIADGTTIFPLSKTLKKKGSIEPATTVVPSRASSWFVVKFALR